MRSKRQDALPHSLAPIGLSREVAAAFIDVSPSKFDQLVADGRMPKPKRIDGRRVWDRTKIERAFSDLSGDEDFEEDEWDDYLSRPKAPTPHDLSWNDLIAEQYANLLGTKLSKAELRLLSALYEARPNTVSTRTIKGIGLGTLGRLQARGYVENTDDLEYHEDRISKEGVAAYEAML